MLRKLLAVLTAASLAAALALPAGAAALEVAAPSAVPIWRMRKTARGASDTKCSSLART